MTSTSEIGKGYVLLKIRKNEWMKLEKKRMEVRELRKSERLVQLGLAFTRSSEAYYYRI